LLSYTKPSPDRFTIPDYISIGKYITNPLPRQKT
jgi:hypothetical protein